MILYYIKIAWRNIKKNRLYFFINLLGLSVGLMACLLIGIYVNDEMSYDKFNHNAERIVRATMEYKSADNINKTALTGTKVGPQFLRTFPNIETYVRTYTGAGTIKIAQESFIENRILFADPDFFEVFTFPLSQGKATDVLNSQDKIVLTASAAQKYFGDEVAIGKTIEVRGKPMTVSGICTDTPDNSQLKFDMVTQFEGFSQSTKREDWWSANWVTYFLLKPNTDYKDLNNRINDYMNSESIRTETRMDGENHLNYNLEPLTTVHLQSELAGHEPNGSQKNINILIAIGLIILVIASANYTNLATAQASTRNAEVGIRKVMGAEKRQVFKQIISESTVICLMAAVLAFFIVILAFPTFNTITGKHFGIGNLFDAKIMGMFVAFWLLVSLMAGLYPAWILASSRIMDVLKTGFSTTNQQPILQRVLLVAQFGISIFLIIYTLVIMKQMNFMHTKNLGYNKEQVVVIPMRGDSYSRFESIKQGFETTPGVTAVTAAYETPEFVQWGDGITTETDNGKVEISLNALPVDLDFAKTMEMEFLAGRDFIEADFSLKDTTNNYANYKQPYIINETLAKKIGWTPEEAIGKTIEKSQTGPIVGVVKDFNFNSLHEPIGPILIFLDRGLSRVFMARIEESQIENTLSRMESTWKTRTNSQPFNYHFLDEDYDKLYEAEQRQYNLFKVSSSIAILLACMGLFGLAAFHIVRRKKEIGIRKTLGADVSDILILTTKNFMKMIILAGVIAIPLAWWAGNQWLQNFAYRINPGIGIFIIALLATMAIAFITVSYHAISAAISKPVNSLRTE